MNFFSLTFLWYDFFFLSQTMNILRVLLGEHEYFSFNFPLYEYFWCFASHPPPHKFSNGPSLKKILVTCHFKSTEGLLFLET